MRTASYESLACFLFWLSGGLLSGAIVKFVPTFATLTLPATDAFQDMIFHGEKSKARNSIKLREGKQMTSLSANGVGLAQQYA